MPIYHFRLFHNSRVKSFYPRQVYTAVLPTYILVCIPMKKKKENFLDRLFGRGADYEDDSIVFEEMDDSMADDDGTDADDNGFFDDDQPTLPERREGDEDLQINLVDKGKMLIAQAIVPGLDENEISIDLNREMLTIETHSNEHCIEQDGDYLYEELSFGSFSRSILLPAEIEVEDSKAEVRDGVLTVTMPKIDKANHKKLNVKKK